MNRICPITGVTFDIPSEDLEFYQKLGLDPPKLSPAARCQRRLSWQNMFYLYRRKCAATGKPVISNVSEDKSFPIYDQEYWWSDDWDFRSFGRDFDFSRTFFENMADLLAVVPQPNLATSYLLDENSDYTNYAGGNKNCYLIFHADMNRDCLYGVGVKKCNDSLDLLHTHGSELLYECVDCRGCYNLRYSDDCENCSDSLFLKNCLGCKHCFGCVNLRQAEYCIYNEQVTKAAYEDFIASFDQGRWSVVQAEKEKFAAFAADHPQRAIQGYQNESVSGDQIFRCRNVHESFDVQESRDMKYCHRIYNGPNSDCFDVNEYGMQIQRVCEGLAIGINAYDVICGMFVNEQVTNVAYSIHVHHSSDIFGCISAVRAKHCIFNKQYSEDEYTKLRSKIISHMRETGEWGDFFPTDMSPFGYNETVANEYFPLTKDQVSDRGWRWFDDPLAQANTSHDDLPDSISDVTDDILQQTLTCFLSGKSYKVQKPELELYRRMKVPIPRAGFHVRHANRFSKRPARRLITRTCSRCESEVQTCHTACMTSCIHCEACYSQLF